MAALARIERLDRLLPQTQCGQCGFDGCRPYAEAMDRGEVGVDRCPPGGDSGARALAHVLGVPALPYDRSRGTCKPPQVAWVVEADCIGCTKCIQACPVDAIVGGTKLMHTVIPPLCTGCELCVPACPVDCIELHPVPAGGLGAS
jgi:electron transport complex protein RnfB